MTARHYGRQPMGRRQRLEAAVEHALQILDLMDGEEDLEPDRDGEEDVVEPSLCAVTMDRLLAEQLQP